MRDTANTTHAPLLNFPFHPPRILHAAPKPRRMPYTLALLQAYNRGGDVTVSSIGGPTHVLSCRLTLRGHHDHQRRCTDAGPSRLGPAHPHASDCGGRDRVLVDLRTRGVSVCGQRRPRQTGSRVMCGGCRSDLFARTAVWLVPDALGTRLACPSITKAANNSA